MSDDFWLDKWRKQEIHFDQTDVNQWLVKYQNVLGDLRNKHVFVPLCGKSVDMNWFYQQGARVTGVELSELAAIAFFEENSLHYNIKKTPSFTIYQHDSVQILCGDFFELSKQHLVDIDLVYDRAALIALPDNIRKNYVKKMASLLNPGVSQFLISIQYVLDIIELPPYSIDENEINTLFSQEFDIQLLEQKHLSAVAPHLTERGIKDIVQSVYVLRRL